MSITAGPYGHTEPHVMSQRLKSCEEIGPQYHINNVKLQSLNPDSKLKQWIEDTHPNYQTHSLLDAKSVPSDNPIVQFLNKHDLIVIPDDELGRGKMGFRIVDINDGGKKDNTKDLFLHRHIFTPFAKHIEHREADGKAALETFESAFDEAVEKNYWILRHDQPAKLRIGFIVVKGDGTEYHDIKLSDIHPGWHPPSLKDLEKESQKQRAEASSSGVSMEADSHIGEMVVLRGSTLAGIIEYASHPFYVPPDVRQAVKEYYATHKYAVKWRDLSHKRAYCSILEPGAGSEPTHYTAQEVLDNIKTKKWRITLGEEPWTEDVKPDKWE